MVNGIGIIVKKEDKEYLDSIKDHPRDTYGDIVHKLIECWKDAPPAKSGFGKPELPKEVDATTPTEKKIIPLEETTATGSTDTSTQGDLTPE